MNVLDIFTDKNDRVVMQMYDYKTRKHIARVYDRYVKENLDRYELDTIKSIERDINDEKEDVCIKYSNFMIQIHDFNNIKKHRKYLKPLLDSIQNAYENKSVKVLNQRAKEKKSLKVKRENKYANVKVGASLLAIGILFGSMLNEATKDFDKSDETFDRPAPLEMSISDYDKLINTSFSVENDTILENVQDKKINLEYEDLSDTPKAINTRENYGETIEKYSNMYGLDTGLMIGIATQESGFHDPNKNATGATGLMQIQNGVWVGNEISAYNFETCTYDKFIVTEDMLSDLDRNIQIGCMYFQNCLSYVDYNIPLAIQNYNYGITNMKTVIDYYAEECGKTREDIITDPYDVGWMDYRDIIEVGDTYYLNNVFSWMGKENSVSVMKPNNTSIKLDISNNPIVEKVY